MKRVAVFAHYDKDNIIDDYVIYYLKALKEIFDKIVFVSCQEISSDEILKLDGIADYTICENHNEYDFGSYKRGYFYLLKNGLEEDYDELAFINDSCYGPFYPLKPLIKSIGNCDFWGISRNLEWKEHIQSFFFVFKRQVFTSNIFKAFMNSIKEERNKLDIVTKYEIGLSQLLIENGFKFDYIVKYPKNYRSNITVFKWRDAVQNYNMPLLKCSILRGKNTFHTTIVDWEKVIPEEYPIELIKKNLERTAEKNINCNNHSNIRISLFNIVGNLRKTPRRIFQNFIKYCLPFLSD